MCMVNSRVAWFMQTKRVYICLHHWLGILVMGLESMHNAKQYCLYSPCCFVPNISSWLVTYDSLQSMKPSWNLVKQLNLTVAFNFSTLSHLYWSQFTSYISSFLQHVCWSLSLWANVEWPPQDAGPVSRALLGNQPANSVGKKLFPQPERYCILKAHLNNKMLIFHILPNSSIY